MALDKMKHADASRRNQPVPNCHHLHCDINVRRATANVDLAENSLIERRHSRRRNGRPER
jgi:hypothetical protein